MSWPRSDRQRCQWCTLYAVGVIARWRPEGSITRRLLGPVATKPIHYCQRHAARAVARTREI